MHQEEIKTCQNCQQQFIIEPEDFKFYEKISVPPPTFCPECRLQRRLAFRNERTLYKRKCDWCKREIISIYRQDSLFTVYCQECWWSDKWDPMDYGKNYDFSKPFFRQFKELIENVPLLSLFGFYHTLINSEYTNQVGHLKNCYLIFNSDYDENCAYGTEIESSKDCFDNLMLNSCQFCFENINCQKCYQVFYSHDCENCRDVWFSKNLIGCSDCFGCANLRNTQYHIFNRPYSRKDYFKEWENFNLDSFENIQALKIKSQNFSLQFPQKFMHGRHNNNVSGDYIYHSDKVFNSYIITEAQNCKYCMWMLVKPVKDCYDFTEYGDNTSNIYESLCCGLGMNNSNFNLYCADNCLNLDYNFYCFNSKNIFSSISLRKKQYCILNKQYSKEEYEALLPKIIQHMNEMPYTDKKDRTYGYGEFFPVEISPFSYNETSAYEFFPLTRRQTLAHGYSWRDPEPRNYQITMKIEEIPDNIKDVSDSILEQVIECAACANPKIQDAKYQIQNTEFSNCATAFRIIKPELEFLRKMNLPLPRLCPNCRHEQRIKQRNPLKLWKRQCMCAGRASFQQPVTGYQYQNTAQHFHQDNPCLNEFETSYSPERPEIVYCEKCYLAEVV